MSKEITLEDYKRAYREMEMRRLEEASSHI